MANINGNQRILYVEDQVDMCELVGVFLAPAVVRPAHTVADGLYLARREPFDLHLLDHYLPDGTGLDLCEMIRLFDTQTSILFYSDTGLLTQQQVLAVGAQGLVKKQESLEVLKQTISQLLNGNHNGIA